VKRRPLTAARGDPSLVLCRRGGRSQRLDAAQKKEVMFHYWKMEKKGERSDAHRINFCSDERRERLKEGG